MTEEVAQPVVATEPVPEPVPIPEPVPETSTAQRVEPLDPEPITEPPPTSEPLPEPSPVSESTQVSEPVPEPSTAALEPIQTPEPAVEPEPQPAPQSEPVSAPEPQIITSISLVSRARELLLKARETIQFRKRKKLEKIMSLFLKKQTLTNDDIQKLLYVSDATATRYLQQLEKEGKIRRQGVPGHASYSRI